MLESIFTFLFRYRPVVYQRGRLLFESGGAATAWLVGLGVILLVAAAVLTWRQRARAGRAVTVLLIGLRSLTVALLVLALLRPILRLATVVPGENFLAVLVDDSRSMRLTDEGDGSRADFATQTFLDPASPVLSALRERFTVRTFRFAEHPSRLALGDSLAFLGNATRLGEALDYARQELAGVPLAGVVVVSDGADNADTTLTDPLLRLQSDGVPVYAVGVGRQEFTKDIEIERVEAPRMVLYGGSFAVDVFIRQHGYAGRNLSLRVESGGGVVTEEPFRLEGSQAATTVHLMLTAEAAGPTVYRFFVPPLADEAVAENNAREILLTVESRREKILHFEGEPRFEVKFLRQAVADDENLQVVTLQRTAENKFLRLGVDDPAELVSGFPKTREELFAYRGLILGSVEASFFTLDQLRIIEEFVSQRGGGLLVLGGRRALEEGGYAGTPVENVLPLVLDAGDADTAFFQEVRVRPTPAGMAHPVTQLAGTAEASGERYATLPPLSMVNPITRAKPGATVLLEGADENGEDFIVLAYQRFGRGKAIGFPVQDSWIWQMHADVPLEDMSHERLWRQLLRWLVADVPDPVTASVSAGQVAPGESVTITADVSDSSYLGVNGAQVVATVTDATGAQRDLPMDWTVEKDGEYRATFTPALEGPYAVTVRAVRAGTVVGTGSTEFRANQWPREYFGAEMRRPLLERMAEETGGRFYTAATAGNLAEDARFTESGNTVVETFPLWNLPVVFFLLLLGVGTEWGVRRWRGLA